MGSTLDLRADSLGWEHGLWIAGRNHWTGAHNLGPCNLGIKVVALGRCSLGRRPTAWKLDIAVVGVRGQSGASGGGVAHRGRFLEFDLDAAAGGAFDGL